MAWFSKKGAKPAAPVVPAPSAAAIDAGTPAGLAFSDLPASLQRMLERKAKGRVMVPQLNVEHFAARLRALKINIWLTCDLLQELYEGTCRRAGIVPLPFNHMREILVTLPGVHRRRCRPTGDEFKHLVDELGLSTRHQVVMFRVDPIDTDVSHSRNGTAHRVPTGVSVAGDHGWENADRAPGQSRSLATAAATRPELFGAAADTEPRRRVA